MTERQERLLLELADRGERVWLTGSAFRTASALERLGLIGAERGRYYGVSDRGRQVVEALRA